MSSDDELSFEEVSELCPTFEATEEENIQLATILNRLRRILPSGLEIEGDICKREYGLTIVQNVLNHFNTWKETVQERNNSIDYVGVKHLAIFSMAKLCFYYWITDSNVVSQVLSHIYECDGHFSSFFTHIINRLDGRLLWPSCIPESKQKENLTLLYFLWHAHNSKMEFQNTRFVDTKLLTPLQVPPAYLACIYVRPKLLLLTLRHGADVERKGHTDDWDLCMLLRHLLRTVWSSLGGADYETTDWSTMVISVQLSDVLMCLNVLLRAIGQIDAGELDFDLASYIQGISDRKRSHDFIKWISDTGAVPRFASRYLGPCELEHLCRLEIRSALNKNWNLPHGVSSLPLPKMLQEYINLSGD